MRLRVLFLGVLIALALAGCSDLGNPLRRAPQCDVSSTRLDFGTVAVNDSATRRLTLRNIGNADLVGVVGLGCGPFRVVTGVGPYSLAPNETLAVVLRFLPA